MLAKELLVIERILYVYLVIPYAVRELEMDLLILFFINEVAWHSTHVLDSLLSLTDSMSVSSLLCHCSKNLILLFDLFQGLLLF